MISSNQRLQLTRSRAIPTALLRNNLEMAGQIDCSCEEILPDGKLPGDVMVIILLNLPVKSLSKFKAVSKPWCRLISSPTFFKLHLHRQSLIPNNLLVSFGQWSNCSFGLFTHNHDKINTADIDLLILGNQSLFSSGKETVFVVDSCNGLVCLITCSCGLILWNPATRKYRSIDYPDHLNIYTLGLCYVEATNDFKLVGWTYRDNPANRPFLFVYSLSSDSWKKLDYDAKKSLVRFQHQNPTFMSGCMHWLVHTCTCLLVCTCAKVIMAFDVTDGAMSCFGVPDNNHGFDSGETMQTLVIKGCLSIVIDPYFEGEEEPAYFDGEEPVYVVWVMVEYGVEESWVKRFTIHGLTQVGIPTISWNDSEIVFVGTKMDSPELTFYDPFSKKKYYYLEFKSLLVTQVFNYVESLASVKSEEGIAPYQLIEG